MAETTALLIAELTAVVKTMTYFHKYPYEQEPHLRNGHFALSCLFSFENLEGKRTRWVKRHLLLSLMVLQLHSFKVLTLSTILLNYSLFWIHFVQSLIVGNFKSFVTSSSHLFFDLPVVRVPNGFHL
jgi:hypothetical protein